MTDEQLRAMAYQVTNMARMDLLNSNHLGMIFAASYDGGPMRRMTSLEDDVTRLFGTHWLSSEDTKTTVFRALRHVFQALPPSVVGMAAVADCYRATDALKGLPRELQYSIVENPAGRVRQMEAGLFTQSEMLIVTVQTPERMCLSRQPLENGLPGGAPNVSFAPLAMCDGRQKMFGTASDRFDGSIDSL